MIGEGNSFWLSSKLLAYEVIDNRKSSFLPAVYNTIMKLLVRKQGAFHGIAATIPPRSGHRLCVTTMVHIARPFSVSSEACVQNRIYDP